MNNISLIGRLATDVTKHVFDNGKTKSQFRIAVKDFGDTEFFNIVTWEKTAELAEQYLVKGKQVGLSGRLTIRSYEKEGQKRYQTEIIANRLDLIGSKSDQESESSFDEPF